MGKSTHSIGGQAVIEGVMMKSRHGWSVAVRDKSGSIQIKKEPLREPPRLFRLPVLRGTFALLHSLWIGIRALEFSAGRAYEEEEKAIGTTAMALTMAAAFVLGIGLFILLPLYAAKLLGLIFSNIARQGVLFNLADGIIRVFVFMLYIGSIGLWKEMRRVFEYHGAEHKVIHAYEAGRPLRAEEIMDLSPHHPRCGTSFLLIVMIMSIVVFSFIPRDWPLWGKFLSRVILIPLVAGLSYEALRLSARLKDNAVVRLMVLPGLALQRLTTREPDRAQVEVAVRALEEVLAMEGKDA